MKLGCGEAIINEVFVFKSIWIFIYFSDIYLIFDEIGSLIVNQKLKLMNQEQLVCVLLQPKCAGELYEELKNHPCLASSSKENARINTTKINKNIQLVFFYC